MTASTTPPPTLKDAIERLKVGKQGVMNIHYRFSVADGDAIVKALESYATAEKDLAKRLKIIRGGLGAEIADIFPNKTGRTKKVILQEVADALGSIITELDASDGSKPSALLTKTKNEECGILFTCYMCHREYHCRVKGEHQVHSCEAFDDGRDPHKSAPEQEPTERER